jgi:hypothetical protein
LRLGKTPNRDLKEKDLMKRVQEKLVRSLLLASLLALLALNPLYATRLSAVPTGPEITAACNGGGSQGGCGGG